MKLSINNREFESQADPNSPLLWVLRDELGLTGTKFGCGIGICGSCTVHIEGVAMRACVTPLVLAEGKEVRTVEGLATQHEDGGETLHPVQQAFIANQVPQCSWCMSGQMMTAAAFLASNPDPEPEDILNAMANNYCRCGCYARIKVAVAHAADLMKAEAEA